jgi:RNA recognition motif-containing protein
MKDDNGQSKGFAFLSFENSDKAEEVKDICL